MTVSVTTDNKSIFTSTIIEIYQRTTVWMG